MSDPAAVDAHPDLAARSSETTSGIGPGSRGALLGLGLGLVVLGQLRMSGERHVEWGLVLWATGLVLVVMAQWGSMPPSQAQSLLSPGRQSSRATIPLIACSVVAIVLVAFMALGKDPATDHTLLTMTWLVSIAALLAAAASATARNHCATAGRRQVPWTRPEWLFVGGIGAVALAVRIVALDRFPSIVDSDGMSLAMVARAVRAGAVRDPFSTGFLGHPTLYSYVQATAMSVFGDSLVGVRLLSALVGSMTVVLTYFLVRRLFGSGIAAATAVLLATFHFHVQFSRLALNNVWDPFFLVVALFFLDRFLVRRRPIDGVAAGLAIGMSQYFYIGSRLLPVIALGFAFVGHGRSGPPWRAWGWVGGAAVAAALPLLVHYVDDPATFRSRFDAVSIFGWLDAERAASGRSTTAILARQTRDAVMSPFAVNAMGHYRPEAPAVGIPMAIPAAIGLAVASAAPGRRALAALAIPWWVTVAGVGLTVQVMLHRWIIGAPLVALAAALGIDAVRRTCGPRARHRVVGGLVAILVAAIALSNVEFYFRSSNALSVYGDENSLIATELGEELAVEPEGTAVWMVASPRMYFRSHSVVPFFAPQVEGHDVIDPLVAVQDVPEAEPGTLFVFLPERLAELDLVRDRYPDGVDAEHRGDDGRLLYATYRIGDHRR